MSPLPNYAYTVLSGTMTTTRQLYNNFATFLIRMCLIYKLSHVACIILNPNKQSICTHGACVLTYSYPKNPSALVPEWGKARHASGVGFRNKIFLCRRWIGELKCTEHRSEGLAIEGVKQVVLCLLFNNIIFAVVIGGVDNHAFARGWILI